MIILFCNYYYYYYYLLLLLSIFFIGTVHGQQQEEVNLLFLGSSYTSADLKTYLHGMFDEDINYNVNHFEIHFKQKWVDHLQEVNTDGTNLNTWLVTNPPKWTYVILQEQSQVGAWPTNTQNSWESVQELNNIIATNIPTAETILMMTWGRRDGDVANYYLFPDFITMNEQLEINYNRFIQLTSTPTRQTRKAPVGLAFEYIYNSIIENGHDPLDPNSSFYLLYAPDGSHPSRRGIYLQACVMYMTFTGNDPRNLMYDPNHNIDTTVLQELRSAAYETVTADNAMPLPISTRPPYLLSPITLPPAYFTSEPQSTITNSPSSPPPTTMAPTTKAPITTISPTTISPTTTVPTIAPTNKPSTSVPTSVPTMIPTISPTDSPTTSAPTNMPTRLPSKSPTTLPTLSPITISPTTSPTDITLTRSPVTMIPVIQTNIPTVSPTNLPTTVAPTNSLTTAPSTSLPLPTTLSPNTIRPITGSPIITTSSGLQKTASPTTDFSTFAPISSSPITTNPTTTIILPGTDGPVTSQYPSDVPSDFPSSMPSNVLSDIPSDYPSNSPSFTPSSSLSDNNNVPILLTMNPSTMDPSTQVPTNFPVTATATTNSPITFSLNNSNSSTSGIRSDLESGTTTNVNNKVKHWNSFWLMMVVTTWIFI